MPWPTLLTSALLLAGISLLVLAAAHDVVARTVPNRLAGILAVIGVALRALAGGLGAALLIATVVFCLAALCWRRGWMGGGDVKLLSATAILVPPALTFSFIAAVAMSGGLLALLYLLARRLVAPPSARRPHTFLARALRVERWRIRRGGPLPYACAIAAGGLLVLL